MNANSQKKMCWNCEGNVQLEEEVCPYCQTSFDTECHAAMQDGSTLYPSFGLPSKIIPAPPFGLNVGESEDSQQDEQEEHEDNSLLSFAYTMALLMQGIILSIFAVVLLLFSHDGKLVLQWNSTYWFLYLGLACPMLYFGARSLKE